MIVIIIFWTTSCLYYTQSGIPSSYQSVNTNAFAFLQSNTIYQSIEEFIDQNTKTTDLGLKSFESLFIIYILFCLIILIINLLHYLLVKMLNYLN